MFELHAIIVEQLLSPDMLSKSFTQNLNHLAVESHQGKKTQTTTTSRRWRGPFCSCNVWELQSLIAAAISLKKHVEKVF